MDKNILIKFFRTNERIGELIGMGKQGIHRYKAIKNPEYVQILDKELDIQYKALKKDYRLLKKQAKVILNNAKRAKTR